MDHKQTRFLRYVVHAIPFYSNNPTLRVARMQTEKPNDSQYTHTVHLFIRNISCVIQ